MRAGWLDRRDEPLWRRVLLSPLSVLSWGYGAVVRLHAAASARGWLGRRRLPARVVSVGNLVVGGTAKTPFAGWLARQLSERGRKVVLASRGYGSSGREPVSVVSDGRYVRGRADVTGDEPMLLAGAAAGVPVLVGRDRGVVGLRALAAFGAEVLVLDDGFQHHRLARDLDLVLFDGKLGFGNGSLLPRGPLREPPSALGRADAVIVIDGPLPPEDEDRLRDHAPAVARFSASRRSGGVRPLAGGSLEPAETLRGQDVGLLAGLARPDSFRRSLEALGAQIVAERVFPDHHPYRAADLQGLAEQASVWVTTEKDAVKLVPTWTGDAEVRVLTLSLEVDEAEAFLDWVEAELR